MLISIQTGNTYEDLTPRIFFRTENATSAEVMALIKDVIELVESDRDGLEHNANGLGKTVEHALSGVIVVVKDHQ